MSIVCETKTNKERVIPSSRAQTNAKMLAQIARRAQLTTEELLRGPIHKLSQDENGQAEYQHGSYAGTFTCHSKFFQPATAQ